MKILVEKFTLQRDGVKYSAGSVVELPDEEAERLVKAAPAEFRLMGKAVKSDVVAKAAQADISDGLDGMDINGLRALAAERGIATNKSFKKQDYIDAIRVAEEPEEESAELPNADLTGTVK